MDSALRPRDIQARIRAGESVEEVAQAAGVPVERIEPFAAPVLAERVHVAGLAQSNPVRRRGETSSNRTLRTATTESLVARGIDPDDVVWDASLLGARRWQVTARFEKSGHQHEAVFVYDVNGRFSVAGNDDARWMIGESGPRPAPSDKAPTRDDDELALVRIVQADQDEADAEVNDAYTETELTEVDGVYDIVASDDPEMDALYDMLASFDEDSVKIYAGLVSLTDAPVTADVENAPSAETPSLPDGARVEPLYVPDDVAAARAAVSVEGPPPDEAGERETEDREGPAAARSTVGAPGTDEAVVAPPEAPDGTAPAEPPGQPPLVETEATARPKPAAHASRRASVPSWDEIMFGSPRKPRDKQ